MFDGMLQDLELETGRINVTRYTQLTLDIASILGAPERSRADVTEIPTGELLVASPALLEAARATVGSALYEAHGRFTHTLLSVVAPLLGFATLLLGGFSRFGIWRRVVGAVALLVVVQSIGLATAQLPFVRPELWPLYYLPTILGLVIVAALLSLAARPALFRRRLDAVPA
jgi:lipopolysaccharide export system permease protein